MMAVQHGGSDAAAGIVFIAIFFCVFCVAVVLGWVVPITLGVRAANRKNYSPLWMLFGIHPLFGWIACVVLLCITPRIQCPNCGGFVTANYRICPFCRFGFTNPPSGPFPKNPPVQ
jgi:hypothetical protein